MMDKLINILRKNETLYEILRKIKILISLFFVYFLSWFDFLREKSCDKEGIRCEYDIANQNYKYTLLGKDTPTCCLTHLYDIMKDVTTLFNKEDINYFIMYGTLLGQVRHNQSFIPWDTDVDIVVMKKDKPKVIKLLKESLCRSYELIDSQNVLKINYSKTNHLHADIYFWNENDDELIDNLNDSWVKNRLKPKDVFPLKISKLYDIDVKVPKNSIKVLKETYGDDCLEKAYKKYALKRDTFDKFLSGKINKGSNLINDNRKFYNDK